MWNWFKRHSIIEALTTNTILTFFLLHTFSTIKSTKYPGHAFVDDAHRSQRRSISGLFAWIISIVAWRFIHRSCSAHHHRHRYLLCNWTLFWTSPRFVLAKFSFYFHPISTRFPSHQIGCCQSIEWQMLRNRCNGCVAGSTQMPSAKSLPGSKITRHWQIIWHFGINAVSYVDNVQWSHSFWPLCWCCCWNFLVQWFGALTSIKFWWHMECHGMPIS